MRRVLQALSPLLIVASGAGVQTGAAGGQEAAGRAAGAVKATIPYAEARPVLEVMRAHLPAELADRFPDAIERVWPDWATERDAEIRARLARGDEDSLVNLWLYGTTFTDRPPARARELARLGGRPTTAEILEGRIEDLVAGIAAPGANERLRFARDVVERRGIDPATAAGRGEVRRFLVETRERVLAEYAATDRIIEAARESSSRRDDPSFEIAAYAAIFQDRGFASDTSILPAFGVEQVLDILRAERVLGARSVRRVAIVGAGLDFINKTDGFDFYPPQTIQPFAIVDSLIRLGLAAPEDLRVTAFDLNPRVNEHLQASRGRAEAGDGYVLQLPLAGPERWEPALVTYWERFGDRVGDEAEALPAPETVAGVSVRAVRIRPDVVRAVGARDLNIVLERLEGLAPEERFDLIVATNILVYYGPFEQSLALANAAAMLRPGGVLLANSGVIPPPPLERSVGYARVVYSDRQYDHMFWYRRE
jgi:hypothetical protein